MARRPTSRFSAKTFEVLRYLIDRPGQRNQKGPTGFDLAGSLVGDTMPAICIAELRAALGDQVKQPKFIETVHRRGYRFIAPVTTAMNVASAPEWLSKSRALLVGREAEISRMRKQLRRVQQGIGGMVLISGTAGVGKTRLAAELGVEAEQDGILTLLGNCYDREDPVPFVPFVEVLEAAFERAPTDPLSAPCLAQTRPKSRGSYRRSAGCSATSRRL